MKPRSLVWRIIGLHGFALLAAAVALPLAIYFLLNGTAESYENRTLRDHAETITMYLTPDPTGGWSLSLPEDLRTFYQHGFDGFAYSVIDQSGRVEFSSLPGGAPILRNDRHSQQPVYFSRQKGKAVYYGASIPEHRGGRMVWVQVAQDLQHPDVIVDDIVADFLRHIAWFTVPILILLGIADVMIVRRALHPVVQASEFARSIDTARLELRLPTRDIPQEILPLVNAVNQALDRIEHGFRTLRHFTTDAAHEIRTPLSVLRLRVDTTLSTEVAAPLRKDIEAMSHVVEELLAVAELEGTLIRSDETADLHTIASDVVSLLAPIAFRHAKDIALTGAPSPVIVQGNRGMLFQAVRNLAENALRHTAPGTSIEIDVDSNGSISVVDEGPGIPEDEQPLIFHRFWRGDGGGSGGAGLGLAIVQRIVDAHGGTVAVRNRTPRGAIFSIQLALVPVRVSNHGRTADEKKLVAAPPGE